jgi:hypothetical protein
MGDQAEALFEPATDVCHRQAEANIIKIARQRKRKI